MVFGLANIPKKCFFECPDRLSLCISILKHMKKADLQIEEFYVVLYEKVALCGYVL